MGWIGVMGNSSFELYVRIYGKLFIGTQLCFLLLCVFSAKWVCVRFSRGSIATVITSHLRSADLYNWCALCGVYTPIYRCWARKTSYVYFVLILKIWNDELSEVLVFTYSGANYIYDHFPCPTTILQLRNILERVWAPTIQELWWVELCKFCVITHYKYCAFINNNQTCKYCS